MKHDKRANEPVGSNALGRLMALEMTMHRVLNLITGGDAAVLDSEQKRLSGLCREALQNTGAIRPDKKAMLDELAREIDKSLETMFTSAKAAR